MDSDRRRDRLYLMLYRLSAGIGPLHACRLPLEYIARGTAGKLKHTARSIGYSLHRPDTPCHREAGRVESSDVSIIRLSFLPTTDSGYRYRGYPPGGPPLSRAPDRYIGRQIDI